jgi:hypothetical protein
VLVGRTEGQRPSLTQPHICFWSDFDAQEVQVVEERIKKDIATTRDFLNMNRGSLIFHN